jgi:hypothetical protein
MQTQLTFLQEDFHANHIALPANEKVKMMSAIYGQKCLEQFEKFNQPTLWAKMLAESLVGTADWFSTKCKLTWKLKGTKYNRLYFQLVPKTHHTEEIEFGLSLLKTPTVMDGMVTSGKKNPVSGNSGTLAQEIMSGYAPTMQKLMLPTPKVGGKEGYETRAKRQGHKKAISHLEAFVEFAMLPTPTAEDNPAKNTGKRNQDGLQKRAFQTTGQTSQLNPRFVAEMMGFPSDWTILPFQNGETKA